MLFIEIILSIHCLLLISSWFIGRQSSANQPSFNLKLMRLLLVSCVISPLIVHCIPQIEKPKRLHFVSLDTIQEYASQSILKTGDSGFTKPSVSALTINNVSYCQIFYLLFCLLIFIRGYRVWLGLGDLRLMLSEAVSYRRSGKLMIKVSHQCHVPFSVYFLNKAYIVLPVSLLSSSKNVKIAIAHEGQHHRNRDCLWAYFIEAISIVFFGNPGVTKWRRVLSELQELSCDEVLVKHRTISPHDYGHCLLKVIQTISQCSMSSKEEFACTVGMATSQENSDSTFIIRRITMLSIYPSNASKPWLLGLAMAGLSILAPIGIAYSTAGSLTSPKAAEIDTSHLDPKMQKIAAEEIAQAVNQYHAKSGVIAIADPSTGNILAFAEASKNKDQSSWKSRVFSPGSTIKPFIAAAAIDAGTSSESKIYDCHLPYRIEGRTFTDYSQFNSVSLTEGLAKSVNTCLIQVAQETGSDVIRNKLSSFGFDMTSWWQPHQNKKLQLARASVGEEIPVTVGSLVKSFAILANKGHSYGSNSNSVVSESTANSVTHMLENAVQNGTGIKAAIPGISVAGKTGTVSDEAKFANGDQLSLFAGYTPVNTSAYVMLVVIEDGYLSKNGKTLTSGGELAAPVFRNVAIKSLKLAKR
ncbi:MAG: cell division protein FtsI [Legionella sp.]|nr:cell division protein FtsI [Legionella sp.]